MIQDTTPKLEAESHEYCSIKQAEHKDLMQLILRQVLDLFRYICMMNDTDRKICDVRKHKPNKHPELESSSATSRSYATGTSSAFVRYLKGI